VGHTRDFDAMATWLTVRTSKSATCQLLRVAWRTIGSIITRVNGDVEATVDRLGGLRRIGIDEISYKRGHRYPIVVVDYDTGRLVWAGPGRSEAALNVFFDELGDERAGLITHVSADMANWIARVVARRAPNAVRCADPFHVVAWTIEALDIERRRAWNQAKGRKIPQSPGRRQLDWIATTHPRPWQAGTFAGTEQAFAAPRSSWRDSRRKHQRGWRQGSAIDSAHWAGTAWTQPPQDAQRPMLPRLLASSATQAYPRAADRSFTTQHDGDSWVMSGLGKLIDQVSV
jgi:transposase